MGEDEHFALRHIWQALLDWQVWALGLLNMAVIMPGVCYVKDDTCFDLPFAVVDGISYFLPCVFVICFYFHRYADTDI